MINEQGEYVAKDKRLASIAAQSRRLSEKIEFQLEYAVRLDKLVSELSRQIEEIEKIKIEKMQRAKSLKVDHEFYVKEYLDRLELLERRKHVK